MSSQFAQRRHKLQLRFLVWRSATVWQQPAKCWDRGWSRPHHDVPLSLLFTPVVSTGYGAAGDISVANFFRCFFSFTAILLRRATECRFESRFVWHFPASLSSFLLSQGRTRTAQLGAQRFSGLLSFLILWEASEPRFQRRARRNMFRHRSSFKAPVPHTALVFCLLLYYSPHCYSFSQKEKETRQQGGWQEQKMIDRDSSGHKDTCPLADVNWLIKQ